MENQIIIKQLEEKVHVLEAKVETLIFTLSLLSKELGYTRVSEVIKLIGNLT